MLVPSLLIGLGFLLLVKGADWLVDGASSLAKKYNVSDLVIGLTIVAFGTSAPELVVNIIASSNDYSDIVFGNIIGSNNFNLLFILGIVGIISPIVVQSTTVWKEIPISFIAAIVLLWLCNISFFGEQIGLSRLDGVILFGLFAAFLFYIYKQLKSSNSVSQNIDINSSVETSGKTISFKIIFGLVGLVVGGKLVVDSAVEVATILGVSEKIIGLTIVAAGTSLPELFTSVVAAMKKNSDLAIGNVIGSNIFNIFLILSISSFVNPISYNLKFNLDIYLLLGGTAFLFIAMFTGQRKKLDRWESLILLATFIGYTYFLISKEI
jgi:cation:H+ antiporter